MYERFYGIPLEYADADDASANDLTANPENTIKDER